MTNNEKCVLKQEFWLVDFHALGWEKKNYMLEITVEHNISCLRLKDIPTNVWSKIKIFSLCAYFHHFGDSSQYYKHENKTRI